MAAPILALRRHRLQLAASDQDGGMGEAYWSERKRVAEMRMRDFDRQAPNVRDIANATGFVEMANYFTSAAEAERAIAENALRKMEQSFHAEFAAAQAEALGITRKPRLSP